MGQTKPDLPSNLQANMENAMGGDFAGVRVHQDQAKQNEMMAGAYAQGNEIHVGQGQEKHLPHEAAHVAQQKQGQVKPNMASR